MLVISDFGVELTNTMLVIWDSSLESINTKLVIWDSSVESTNTMEKKTQGRIFQGECGFFLWVFLYVMMFTLRVKPMGGGHYQNKGV